MGMITDAEMNSTAGEKDLWLTDDAPKGHGRFCARITKGGERLFYFRYTAPGGKREYIALGKYNQKGINGLSLKVARAMAGDLSRLYQNGATDLKGHIEAEQRIKEAQRAAEEARLEAERRAAEIEAARLSVTDLFEKWHKQDISKHRDGGRECRRLFEKDVIPAIGTLPAHLIRKGHIMQIFDEVAGRGATRTAKIIFSSLRQMFRFALARDFVEVDPTAAISKKQTCGADTERERVLSEEEITLLARQLPTAAMTPMSAAAIWIALSTGCRIGELLKARWEHVDLDNSKWTIPAENAKNGEALEVHLSDFALTHFRTLKEYRHCRDTPAHYAEWIYPARNKKMGDCHVSTKAITKQTTDRQRPQAMSNRSPATSALLLPGGKWTPHDLRRTASTIMGSLGIKPEVVDRCQNHKEENKIRRTYQRYSYQPEMREAWDLLGARLEALTSEQPAAKIIQLRKKANQ